MILGEVDAPFAKDFRDRPLTTFDTIGDPYAPVAAPGEGEASDLSTPILDQCDPVKVPEGLLGHAKVPAEDA